jgi:hypothetical protein
MRKNASLIILAMVALSFLSGCGGIPLSQFREPSYTQSVGEGTVVRQYVLGSALEERILALDPERVTESDIREVLSHAPAPRIVNIHGGIFPVYLCMESFSQFLIGMGYPEWKIRNPGDGSFSFSCYKSSEKIAGAIAWYYEKEGMRPMLVGHSQGGIQAVKVLCELAGCFRENVAVYNPLTGEGENRTSILDPLTGRERPVVGLQVSYATAVGAGGFTRVLPNQWVMAGRLRTIPDTAAAFTGFVVAMDLLGGDLLGFGPANRYAANGKAEVRNVQLPLGYNHVTVPVTAHLAESQEIRDWINRYVPTEEPKLDVTFESDSKNILWAADVWHSIKKHWVMELHRLIRARREKADAH